MPKATPLKQVWSPKLGVGCSGVGYANEASTAAVAHNEITVAQAISNLSLHVALLETLGPITTKRDYPLPNPYRRPPYRWTYKKVTIFVAVKISQIELRCWAMKTCHRLDKNPRKLCLTRLSTETATKHTYKIKPLSNIDKNVPFSPLMMNASR
jgi:hypothetical protein